MSDQYRLVFTGEIAEDQHLAVVKRRLSAVLNLNDERVEMLFAGKPVVVKKAADEKTAARFQAVFDKAGARLRVLPIDSAATKAPASGEQPESAPPAAVGDSGSLNILPVGADLLAEPERAQPVESNIDTSHLSVQGTSFNVDESREPIAGPNVDHLTLAELGARLGVETSEVVIAEIEVNFTLAEAGAIIGQIDAEVPQSPIDIDSVDFELAEVGAVLDTRKKEAPPPPPDTSHLSMDDE